MKNARWIAALIFVISCNSQKNVMENQAQVETNSTSDFDLKLEGKWVLDYMSPVNGKDVKELFKIQMPYLTFVDQQRVAGNNGCNNIAGSYTREGQTIRFETDKFASTKMYCEGIDEQAFTSILKTVNNYQIIEDGNKLVLLTSDIFSMRFVKEK